MYQSREAATGKPQLIVTLTQNQPPSVTITAPANGFRANPGVPITFTGPATDAENGNLSSQHPVELEPRRQPRHRRVDQRADAQRRARTSSSPGSWTMTAASARREITVNVGHRAGGPHHLAGQQRHHLRRRPAGPFHRHGDRLRGRRPASRHHLDVEHRRHPRPGADLVDAARSSLGTHTIIATVTDSTRHPRRAAAHRPRARTERRSPIVHITAPADDAPSPSAARRSRSRARRSTISTGTSTGQIHWTSSRERQPRHRGVAHRPARRVSTRSPPRSPTPTAPPARRSVIVIRHADPTGRHHHLARRRRARCSSAATCSLHRQRDRRARRQRVGEPALDVGPGRPDRHGPDLLA